MVYRSTFANKKTPTEVSVFYQKISNSASMKYYAVIDTNVLVSAMLKHDSVPGSIIDLAFDGMITPVMNKSIEAEYRNVL